MRRGGRWSWAIAIAACVLELAAMSCSKPQQQASPEDAAPPASSAPIVASAPIPSASASEAASDAPADLRAASASPSDRALAPMKLVVSGPATPPTKGEFVLSVDIVATEPLQLPLMLRIDLPAGARLTKGAKQETVSVPKAGTITKQYTIAVSAPLTAPILVVGETRSDAGVVGLHAERKYPLVASVPSAAAPAASKH